MAGTWAKVGSTAAVVVLAAAGIVYVLRQGGDDTGPEGTVEDYLAAWGEADTAAMAELVAEPPATFAETHEAVVDGLSVTAASFEMGDVTTDDDTATVAFDATLSLTGLGEWAYTGALQLGKTGEDDAWQVAWTPASIHPSLRDGTTLGRTRERPARAVITDMAGQPLLQEGPAVTVGIEPQRMEDRQVVKDALGTNLGVDPATVDNKLDAPGVQPNHFVPIVTLARPAYDQVRDAIHEVKGLVFRETTMRSGPSDGFARHVLGRMGEITAERLEELGPSYQAGDQVGLTGLEARFETQLAGTPSGEIQLKDANGTVVEALGRIEGTAPTPLATTLDPTIQAAVEEALAGLDKPAAAVVVDAQSNIRAAASLPLDDGFNRSLGGTYPPGSTFKVVTGSALLDSGVTADTPVDCPETVNAGGRIFKNFEGGSLGSVPFGTAFAESCNTAFVNATTGLAGADLVAAAGRFGFNTDYSVGLTTEGGSFPEPADDTEKAAAAIGQGRVVASPLHMATVAAAVIDGTWDAPTLLPEIPGENRPASTQLAPATRDTLAGLMRRVVTEGSGTAADAPGTEVAGKTGTAEFGSGDPLPTHAWFIGFRGDLALAIVIEGGGVGGRDAAPVAGQIFGSLP